MKKILLLILFFNIINIPSSAKTQESSISQEIIDIFLKNCKEEALKDESLANLPEYQTQIDKYCSCTANKIVKEVTLKEFLNLGKQAKENIQDLNNIQTNEAKKLLEVNQKFKTIIMDCLQNMMPNQ